MNVSARIAASHSLLLIRCSMLSVLQRDSAAFRSASFSIMALMGGYCFSSSLAVAAAQHSKSLPAPAAGAVMYSPLQPLSTCL